MRDEISSEFISVIARSLQNACHGCVDFTRNIHIVGHIYLCVDSETQYNYILNEKLCKDLGDARTVAQSRSFHAEYPLGRGNLGESSLTETNFSDSAITPKASIGPNRSSTDAGNHFSLAPLGVAEVPELGSKNVEVSSVVVQKQSVKRKKRKGSPCKVQLPLTDCPFDDDSLVHFPDTQEETKLVSSYSNDMQERGCAISTECRSTLPSRSDYLPNIKTDLQIGETFSLQNIARNHPQSCATSPESENCPSRVDLSVVKKEVLELENLNSQAQTHLASTPTSSGITLPFQQWSLQPFLDGTQQAREGSLENALLRQVASAKDLSQNAPDGMKTDAGSLDWMQMIPAVELGRGENAEMTVRISAPFRPPVSLASPPPWPLALLTPSSTSSTDSLRHLGSSSTPSMVHIHGGYSSEELTPSGSGPSAHSFYDTGGKVLSTAAVRMRRYRQRLKEDKEKYEQHRERQSRYARTYLSSLTEEQKAKRREKVKICMREWRKKRKEQGMVKQESDSEGKDKTFMQLPSPLYQCTTDQSAQMST